MAQEISRQIKERDAKKIAAPTEILQFYTSVMRGEVLDQFGIELAKHQIERPLKLEQKNVCNNIGSIQINILPRKEEIVVSSEEIV